MKAFRLAVLSVCVAAGAALLGGCGNSLEDGSEPSGSIIRVVGVTPSTVSPSCDSSKNLTAKTVQVEMLNDSRPNTPTGRETNSFVTMSRYRVDYTGLNMTVKIPSLDGGGATVGIPPGETKSMTVAVMDSATLGYIRSYYPMVGVTDSLSLRATITIWGEDSFKTTVSTTAEATIDIYEVECSSTDDDSSTSPTP